MSIGGKKDNDSIFSTPTSQSSERGGAQTPAYGATSTSAKKKPSVYQPSYKVNNTKGATESAASWANNLAYSAYAPQYSAIASQNEAGLESLRLGQMGDQRNNAYGQRLTDNANNRIRSGLGFDQKDYESAEATARTRNAGTDIDMDYLNRQNGYLADMLGFAKKSLGLDEAVVGLDEGAVDRQFPLLAKEREDIGTLHQNFLATVQAEGEIATKDERLKQLELISMAAANGSAGAALPTERAHRTAQQLQEELAAGDRKRIEGRVQYEAAIRKNDENMAQARDAKEKIKIERERIRLEQERKAREYMEEQARVEDDKKRKALERFYTAIALQQAQNDLARKQQDAMYQMNANNLQQQQAQFYSGIQQQQNFAKFLFEVARRDQEKKALEAQQFADAQALATRAPRVNQQQYHTGYSYR